MAANFSSSERGVRPGANGRKQARKLTCRRDENMRLDALLRRMENRSQTQIILEIFEGGLHLRQLNVELPQFLRGLRTEVAAQEITPLASSRQAAGNWFLAAPSLSSS